MTATWLKLAAFLLAGVLALLMGETATISAQKQTKALAGWYDVFPHFQLFSTWRIEPPVVGKTKDGQATYSQTVTYDAATGLVRSFHLKLVRDPAIKQLYAPEVLRAQENPPEELKVGAYRAWSWKDGTLVVIFDDDKAAVVTKAPRSVASIPLKEVDNAIWERMAKALKEPPRTDFTPTLDTFRVMKKGSDSHVIYEWCGPPPETKARADKAGSFLATYVLADGSRVLVGFGRQIEFIRHETTDGKLTELLK